VLYALCSRIQSTHFVSDTKAAWAGFKAAEKAVEASILEELFDLWEDHALANLELLRNLYGNDFVLDGYEMEDGANDAATI
jgi:hypothetical protein